MTTDYLGKEEGDACGENGCEGTLVPAKVENCTCFISPPCSACIEAGLVCDVCEREVHDD